MQLIEGLPESGRISQVSARTDDVVRRMPIELFHKLENRRLLSFNAKWIDGVQEVLTGVFLLRHLRKRLIEVAIDFDDLGSVVHRLSDFCSRQLPFRQIDPSRQA